MEKTNVSVGCFWVSVPNPGKFAKVFWQDNTTRGLDPSGCYKPFLLLLPGHFLGFQGYRRAFDVQIL